MSRNGVFGPNPGREPVGAQNWQFWTARGQLLIFLLRNEPEGVFLGQILAGWPRATFWKRFGNLLGKLFGNLLRAFWEPFRNLLGTLKLSGSRLKLSGNLLGSFWKPSGNLLGAFWEPSESLLKAFWKPFGSFLGISGNPLGAFWEASGNVSEEASRNLWKAFGKLTGSFRDSQKLLGASGKRVAFKVPGPGRSITGVRVI